MAKLTIAEFARKIQRLSALSSPTEKGEMELRFYFEVIQKISEIDICNLVPLDGTYPEDNAKKWANSLGMNVVVGSSGTMYLSWSKGLFD